MKSGLSCLSSVEVTFRAIGKISNNLLGEQMKTPDIIEGLTILQKYRDNPDGYHTHAEHDCIYALSTDKPLSDEDLSKMIDLGWFQDIQDYIEDDDEGGFTAEQYQPEESWQCFT